MTNKLSPMVIIALIMAFGILGVVVVDTIIDMEQAEAKSPTGQCASIQKNSGARFCH